MRPIGQGASSVLLLVTVLVLGGCKASDEKATPVGRALPDQFTMLDARARRDHATADAPVAVDAAIHANMPKPAVFVEFEKLLDAHTKKPATPERTLATCGLIRKDDERLALLAPADARPEAVTEEEWDRARHAFVETEIDIAEMCEDMDGKPEGGEDEEVLRLLRQRYENLVELTRRP